MFLCWVLTLKAHIAELKAKVNKFSKGPKAEIRARREGDLTILPFNFRKFIRAYVPLRVDYKILGEPQIEGKTLSKNFSTSGINILIPQGLKQKTLAELKIYLPSTPGAISVKGKIVWQTEVSYVGRSKRKYFTTGIEFTEIDSTDESKLVKSVIGNLREKSEEQNNKLIDKIEALN